MVSTGSTGNTGDLTIQARNSVNITENGNLALSALSSGSTGNLRIETGTLKIENTNGIGAFSSGSGSAGSIFIQAKNAFEVINGQIITGALLESKSRSDITIDTKRFNLTNGAALVTNTFGAADAGNIVIRASESASMSGVSPSNSLYANTEPGGNVSINANTIDITNGGQILTSTSSSGQAGNITLNAKNVNLAGIDSTYAQRLNEFGRPIVTSISEASGLYANTTGESSGKGGTIRVNAERLNIRDRASISVDSRGSGVAGDINVNSQSARLSGANIVAETASQDGGNINIENTDLLLLRRGSLISATAAEGGNGGNIKINAQAIVAVPKENSRIRANAVRGNGGNININTLGIFGIKTSPFPLEESDITASSQLGVQGQISITQPDVDPTQGIIELPNEVVDASNQIGQTCPRGSNAKPLGEFVVTGRGSLPPNPLQPLAGTTTPTPLATLDGKFANKPFNIPTSTPPEAIVEAQGWVKTADGQVILTASAPEATPSASLTTAICSVSK